MTILEVVLLITIIVLIVVLLLETREYRRHKAFTDALEKALTSYTAGFNAIATTIQAMEGTLGETAREHKIIVDEVIRQGALLEIHNNALQLSPKLIDTIKDGEDKIP